MTHRAPILNKLTARSTSAMLAVALCLPIANTQAGELLLKTRDVSYKVERTWIQIGEDENHGIGTYQQTGLSFLEDDQIGTTVDKGIYEQNKGSGTHQGYYVVTFSDGSGWTKRYDGTFTLIGEKTYAMKGVVTLVGGTGRFEGIEGEGTYIGTEHSNGMLFFHTEIAATVPD